MSNRTRPQQEHPESVQRRAHVGAVARVVVLAVITSELITIVLMKALVGDHIVEGMIIAAICSAPLSGWITNREITMRRLVAQQRDQVTELNLELKARNADLDAFARAVAHDLKNPLTTIVGLADVLATGPHFEGEDEPAEFIRSILESGDRAVEIIDGLLLLHGIQHETQELTRVDTSAALDTALETLTGVIAHNRAKVARPPTLPSVQANGPWLTQVWVNLIGNAIKYGGTPPAVHLTARASSNNMIRFEVRDNGAGIAPNDRDRIFNEFERGHSPQIEGHGLGLAIASRVIGRLGGEIGVDSAPEGGSIFWFTVPAV